MRLSLSFGVPLNAALHLSLGAQAGLLAFARSTIVHDPALSTTSDATVLAGVFGPEILVRARVSEGVGVELALRADLVPDAPRYAVDYAGKTLEVARDRVFEPAVCLGLFWAF
jgi:hypothetical protein